MSVSRMFFIDQQEGKGVNLAEFEISGSTYEPVGDVTKNGARVKPSDYDNLVELATICAMCNDSSVDYNEVRVSTPLY